MHSAVERDSANARPTWALAGDGRLAFLGNAVSIPRAQDPLGLTRAQFDDDPRQVAAVAEQSDTRKRVDQNRVGTGWEWPLARRPRGARRRTPRQGYLLTLPSISG